MSKVNQCRYCGGVPKAHSDACSSCIASFKLNYCPQCGTYSTEGLGCMCMDPMAIPDAIYVPDTRAALGEDVKESDRACTCDFYTVIMPFGCKCNGK